MSYKKIIDKIPNDEFLWVGDEPSLILDDNKGRRWFLITDIARVLGYSRYEEAIKKHVDPKYIVRFGKIRSIITDEVSNRVQDNWRFLSEEGLYHFIDTSNRKEKAKELKKKYFPKTK